jgi:hypothetical protein
MVAAAFVESCWERIDDAKEAKLLSLFRDAPSLRPIVQNPERSITISKRGLILMISRAALLDWAREITISQTLSAKKV